MAKGQFVVNDPESNKIGKFGCAQKLADMLPWETKI
jgi:hypothetical protein